MGEKVVADLGKNEEGQEEKKAEKVKGSWWSWVRRGV